MQPSMASLNPFCDDRITISRRQVEDIDRERARLYHENIELRQRIGQIVQPITISETRIEDKPKNKVESLIAYYYNRKR